MNVPDLNLLIALDALLAEASVAGAARRLGLSASAMSRTLSRLRATTGDPLLVRAGRHMVLTPHAEAIRERTQHTLFDTLTLLRPSPAELALSTLERTFVLRTNEGFIEAFGPTLIVAAATCAPHVRLRFVARAEKSAKALREGLVDLEVGVLGEMGPEIRIQTLFRDRFVGVVRPGHPLAMLPEVGISDYLAHGHVVASRRGHTAGPVDMALAERGLERTIAAVVPGFPAALAVVQASELVGLIPASFLIHQPAAAYSMFELPVKVPGITLSQMWHPRAEADPAHRWLRQFVLEVCRKHAPAPHQ
ncbi:MULTISPECIES: LysR family transcriptional regulator [Enterobacteriaceae]|jgi:DNA-binding transcriptional LysR family regulator|uniref:LysR family transcriptional regulator n=1 Tax=Enterobacteriaceae TaxID=543 RepID=UPI0011AAC60E|nr:MULTISPECIES: LysR family transcriptional regulator [Enterobacteriaceae]WPO97100.1 LysR family transcriptional regulator [Buttiauxella sp. HR94]